MVKKEYREIYKRWENTMKVYKEWPKYEKAFRKAASSKLKIAKDEIDVLVRIEKLDFIKYLFIKDGYYKKSNP